MSLQELNEIQRKEAKEEGENKDYTRHRENN